MKQEEMKNNALSDEVLETVAGGASSMDQVKHAFVPGDKVICSRPRYIRNQPDFVAIIQSQTVSLGGDRYDVEYYPAYYVIPEGETSTVLVSESLMRRF